MNVYCPPPPRPTWRTKLELVVGLFGLSLLGAARLSIILGNLGVWVFLAWLAVG